MSFVKKRLIYHAYVFDNFEENIIYRIHFACLKHYANIFDEVIFYISIDDVHNYILINRFKKIICNIFRDKRITFEIVSNKNLYYEGNTLNQEFLKKKETFEGFTFFAHSKGVCDILGDLDYKVIAEWVLIMYFFNLQFIDEVETFLIRTLLTPFYGTLLNANDGVDTRNGWYYSGTFYWMNDGVVKRMIKRSGMDLCLDSRHFAERFPGDVCPITSSCTHKGVYYNYLNLYYESPTIDSLTRGDTEEMMEYENFHTKMMKEAEGYIQVIVCATGDYSHYMENFINTIDNFFPDRYKKITCLTDRLQTDIIAEAYEVKYQYMPQLIYPCINLNKPMFINALMDKNAKYAFYIDVDTIFKPNTTVWEKVEKILDNDELLLTTHPAYLLKDKQMIEGFQSNQDWLYERDEQSSAYVDKQIGDDYIISSFFGGKPDIMNIFCKHLTEEERKDLLRFPNGYHIPNYIDEAYVNRMYYDYKQGNNNTIKFCTMSCCEMYNYDNIESTDCFLYQKGMEDFKSNRQ